MIAPRPPPLPIAALQWGREIEPSEMVSLPWKRARCNPLLQWGREIEPSEISTSSDEIQQRASFNGAERLNPRKSESATGSLTSKRCFNGAERLNPRKLLDTQPHQQLGPRFNGAERLNPRKLVGDYLMFASTTTLQWGREIEPSEIRIPRPHALQGAQLQWGREIEPSEIAYHGRGTIKDD